MFVGRALVTAGDTRNGRDATRSSTTNVTENSSALQLRLDFDRLVLSVESSIMIDQERALKDISPQELLLRSNPALFSSSKENLRDLTNPRDVYSILSHKHKSSEEIGTRFKQELSKSLQSSGALPKLSRTTSLHDFQRNTYNQRQHRRGGKFLQSTAHVFKEDDKLDVLVLTRHRTNIDDIRKISEDEKENLRSLNLPNITKESHGQFGNADTDARNENKIEFPDLQAKQTHEATGTFKHSFEKSKSSLTQSKKRLSASDSKLDKWFSEMPNEVFDKAQRALMEESIKDRLQKYQNKRRKRVNFPNDNNVNVYVGSKMKKVPNTYLELHVDSFGKHLLTDDPEEKMNRYKLLQKSMHHLKMREMDDFERMEKPHEDDIVQKMGLQHRSLTTLALSRSKPVPEPPSKPKRDIISIPTDKSMKTVNMNDRIDLDSDQGSKPRHYQTNYEEYAERLGMMKASQNQTLAMERLSSPPHTVQITGEPKETLEAGIEREKPKAKIVNIALKKDIPIARKPVHFDKYTEHQQEENIVNDEANINDKEDIVNEKVEKDQNITGEDTSKHGTIVTKIPTARSTRTSDSKSSSSSVSKENKSPLKRFNKLEVFAENAKHRDRMVSQKVFHGHTSRNNNNLESSTGVKFDLKQYPHKSRSLVKENGEIVRNEVRMQDVVFRFEPGEVFISTRQNAMQSTHNRCSERARIIYGKSKDDKKDTRERKFDSKDNLSVITKSTKLDGYQKELSKFESRAIAESPDLMQKENDISVNKIAQYDNTLLETSNVVQENVNGVMTRDVAIETDIIGSESGSVLASGGNAQYDEGGTEILRTCSNLSDLIINNNDGGESLVDSDEESDCSETNLRNGGHSV